MIGNSGAEGFLELSGNGQYLTLGGYDVGTGTATVSGTAWSVNPRTVGLVSVSTGSVDTKTAMNSGSSGAIRSVATVDGTAFWSSTSGANVQYVGYGLVAAPTQIGNVGALNTRVTRIFGGQLYASGATGTGPLYGVGTVGSGVPTVGGQTTTELSGFPTASGPSSYDYFLSGNNLWVTDDRASGAGGLQKWTLSGGVWSLQYTIAESATIGDKGLAVDPNSLSGTPTFYVTTTGNTIDKVVDGGTLALSSDTIEFTGAANTGLRGIAFIPGVVPEPSVFALLGLGVVGLLSIRRRK
jgi:hypothetical protein